MALGRIPLNRSVYASVGSLVDLIGQQASLSRDRCQSKLIRFENPPGSDASPHFYTLEEAIQFLSCSPTGSNPQISDRLNLPI
jgi:hypothetical protein